MPTVPAEIGLEPTPAEVPAAVESVPPASVEPMSPAAAAPTEAVPVAVVPPAAPTTPALPPMIPVDPAAPAEPSTPPVEEPSPPEVEAPTAPPVSPVTPPAQPAPTPAPPAPEPQVSGTVADPSGAPSAGCAITLGDLSAESGADGSFGMPTSAGIGDGILEVHCDGVFQRSIRVENPDQALGNITVYGQPNIVFLLTDDQAYWAAGFNGNAEILTPNMDELAAQGVAFDRHYNTTAICMGSRATVLAGKYEYNTGINFTHEEMMPAADYGRTYAMRLRDAGYFVGFFGKHGFDTPANNAGQAPNQAYRRLPFDRYDRWRGGPGQTSYTTGRNVFVAEYADQYPHASRAYGAAAGDFFEEAKASGKPFNLSISFKAPHNPMTPDPEFDELFQGKTWSRPENYGRAAGQHLAEQGKTGRQFQSFFTQWWADPLFDARMSNYYQLIYGVDAALGMLRASLQEQGLAENTVIILTSDNGYFAGNHGLGGKTLPYEESTKAPAVVYDPRRAATGQQHRISSLTGNVDMGPTILSLAGIPVPEDMDGKNLLPLLDRPETKVRDWMPLFATYIPETAKCMSIVTDTWKYIFWPASSDGLVPTEELFHVDDPLEMQNLAGDTAHAAALQQMRAHHTEELDRMAGLDLSFGGYDRYAEQFRRR